MAIVHKIIDGGEQYLGWALAKLRSLQGTGHDEPARPGPRIRELDTSGQRIVARPRKSSEATYTDSRNRSLKFEFDDATVIIRLVAGVGYIHLEGIDQATAKSGGYVVAVESDTNGNVEDSLLSGIALKKIGPPYTRTDHKYKHYETVYWVGGTSAAPRVSHTTGNYNEYVKDAGKVEKWTRGSTLLKVFYNEASSAWVYVEAGTPTGGVGLTLLAANAVTSGFDVIGVLAVTGSARMDGGDLLGIDASPDGSKLMFVWRKTDPLLGFTLNRFVREHAVSKWTDQDTKLPVVSQAYTDTDVSDEGTDTRNFEGRGATTSTKKSFFGYSWDGVMRYATEVSTWEHLPEPPGDSSIFDELGYYPDGTYPTSLAPITQTRKIYIGGALVAQAQAIGAGSGTVNIGDTAVVGGVTLANRSGDDFALKHFDPRSGAYMLIRSKISIAETLVYVVDPTSFHVRYDATLSKSGSLGPVTCELHMGSIAKTWELSPQAGITSSASIKVQSGVLGFAPTVDLSLAAYARLRFASRKKGEAVFSLQVALARIFAVVGEANSAPAFISEDASGLKSYGTLNMRVTEIYPI